MPLGSVSPMMLPGQDYENTEGLKPGLEGPDGKGRSRSPTPEPEETTSNTVSVEVVQDQDIEMISESSIPQGAVPLDGSPSVPHSGDPGNQPYLGRVDELDTGPIHANPIIPNNGRTGREEEHEGIMSGAGEGGAMTPHGMSEKPVPISSTTVISEEERRIAGIRQQGHGTEKEA